MGELQKIYLVEDNEAMLWMRKLNFIQKKNWLAKPPGKQLLFAQHNYTYTQRRNSVPKGDQSTDKRPKYSRITQESNDTLLMLIGAPPN